MFGWLSGCLLLVCGVFRVIWLVVVWGLVFGLRMALVFVELTLIVLVLIMLDFSFCVTFWCDCCMILFGLGIVVIWLLVSIIAFVGV